MLSIGALAKRTGVKVPTIRYYEQAGLLDEPERTSGNQRRYGQHDAERLSFIRHARDLGFPLEAIRELIDLGSHPDRPCDDANRIAGEQLASVRDRILRLKRLERELERIATGCSGDTAERCYVLNALADHSLCERDHTQPV
jgi:DNA-binding transcriptional MerR regulator